MIASKIRIAIFLVLLSFSAGFLYGWAKDSILDQSMKQPNNILIDNSNESPNQGYNRNMGDSQDASYPNKKDNSPESHKEEEIFRNNTQEMDSSNKVPYSPSKDYSIKARVLQNKFPQTFIMEGNSEKKEIALTFDDGPDSKTTPKILDILQEHGIKATFFIVGQNAKAHPQIIERILNEGHQIGAHSWSHERPTELSNPKFLKDIEDTSGILNNYEEDYNTRYYRPPYGLLKPHQIELMKERGYLVISWSIDSLDWYTSDDEEIYKTVINSSYPGAIILMHSAGGKDHRLGTVKALPRIIDNLLGQGYEFVAIQELVHQR